MSAMSDLKLDGLDLIHGGAHTFALTEAIRALTLGDIVEAAEPLR